MDKTVTRGFGRLLAVPAAFTILTGAFGTTPIPSVAANTAVYGSESSPITQFREHKSAPQQFAHLQNLVGTTPIPRSAVYWGDNYQPRANFTSWRATVVNDNTVLPTKAIQGSEVVLKSQFAGFNIPGAFNLQQNFGTTPIPRLAVLWGDGFQPRSQHGTWLSRITNDNPVYAQQPGINAVSGSEVVLRSQFPPYNVATAFNILSRGWNSSWLPADHIVWGDNFQPRSQLGTWTARGTLDNPQLGTPAAGTILWGDNFQPRSQLGSWNPRVTNDIAPLPRTATLWGDNFQPRSQHGRWSPSIYYDNPVFAFLLAVSGDTFIARSKFEPYNIGAEFNSLSQGWTTTWRPSLRILWGDGFRPFARHTSWTARDFLMIPRGGGGDDDTQQPVGVVEYRKIITLEERIGVVKG